MIATNDKQLPKPGVYVGMPDDEYFALPFISKSLLSELRSNPRRACAMLHGERFAPSYSMLVGTALEDALQRPEDYAAKYIEGPTKTPDTKAWVKCQQENPDKSILTADDLAAIPNMVRDVREHEVAGRLVSASALRQTVVIAPDEATGLMCKGKSDFLTTFEGYTTHVDLKKIRTGTLPDWMAHKNDLVGVGYFMRSYFKKYGYHLQDAQYLSICEDADRVVYSNAPRYRRFMFIFVEDTPNAYTGRHRVMVFELTDYERQQARQERAELLAFLKQCITTNTWPEPPQGIWPLGQEASYV